MKRNLYLWFLFLVRWLAIYIGKYIVHKLHLWLMYFRHILSIYITKKLIQNTYALWLLFVVSHVALSAEPPLPLESSSSPAPSLKINQIVVTATRTPQIIDDLISQVSVIDREEIERSGAMSLTDILQRQSGIQIKQSGGLGTISSLYLRGTNANHVVILIDGLRVNSVSAGTTALENLPLSQIERIEILRGPASHLYGQDAIGGVIQIYTRTPTMTPEVYAKLGYGSYNTRQASAGFRYRWQNTGIVLDATSSNTTGFSAQNIHSGIRSDNDGYRNLAVNFKLTQEINERHGIDLQFLHNKGHVAYDRSQVFANYADMTQMLWQLNSHHRWMDNWTSNIKIGEGRDISLNFWGDNRNDWTEVESIQRQYAIQNNWRWLKGEVTLLFDRLEQRVQSNILYTQKRRDNNGIAVAYQLGRSDHALQANLRYDDNSQYGGRTTGYLGYGYHFNPDWMATISYATAFKAPTFNDTYAPIFWGSNPNLKPETSQNTESSLRYKTTNKSLSLTLFYNEITDLILADTNWKLQNVAQAKIQGLNLEGEYLINDYHFKSNINLQKPLDDTLNKVLPYRAERNANFNLTRVWGNWQLGGELMFNGRRFADANNQYALGGFAIANLFTTYKLNSEWTSSVKINNLFDRDYTVAIDTNPFVPYRTPRLNLFFSLQYSPSL